MVVRLNWSPRVLGDGQRVYRSTDPLSADALPAPLAELGPAVSRFDDSTALAGTLYYYAVSVVSGLREALSNVVVVSATGDAVQPPVGNSLVTLQDRFLTYPLGGAAYGPVGVYSAAQNQTIFGYVTTPGTDNTEVRIYDHASNQWLGPRPLGTSSLRDDDHGNVTMELLSDGRIVSFWGSHNSEQNWAISDATDFFHWDEQTALQIHATYPKAVNVPGAGQDGTLYLLWRDWQTNSNIALHLMSASYTANGPLSFSSETVLIKFDSERIYAAEARLVGGDIEFFWSRADLGDSYRRDLYFARYKTATGALENFDGSVSVASGSLPISRATGDADFRLFASGDNEYGIASWVIDAQGDYHVLHRDKSDSETGSIDMIYRRYDASGSSWSSQTFTDVLHAYGANGFVGGDLYTLSLDENDDPEIFHVSGQAGGWTSRGGDGVIRLSGPSFATSETVVSANTHAIAAMGTINYAHQDLRVLFAERSQDSSPVLDRFLPIHVYGAGGMAAYTDQLDFGSVVFQVDFAGSDGSTDFSDLAYGVKLSAVGGAQITSGRLSLNGSSDYVQMSSNEGSERYTRRFNWEADEPFCIEFFDVRLDTVENEIFLLSNHGLAGDRGMNVVIRGGSNNDLRFVSSPDGNSINSFNGSYTWAANVDYYLRIERDAGGTLRMFVGADGADAVMVGSGSYANKIDPSSSGQPMLIGTRPYLPATYDLDGHIGAVRISKGESYVRGADASFTPDVRPLFVPT